MVEPIGLTGTLIGLVQVSCSIVQSCYDYYRTVKDAPQDISRILAEGKSLRDVAERLLDLATGKSGAALSSLQAMSSPGGPLETCLQELTKLEHLLRPEKKKWRKFILKWPLTKPQANISLATMDRIKGMLQLALATDNAVNTNMVLENTMTLPIIQKGVSRIVKHVDSKEEAEKISKRLHRLDGLDQQSRQREQCEKSIAGTGEWFFGHNAYTEWKTNPRQVLWVHGISGCGKTVLCSKTIQNLRDHCDTDPTRRSLCYFFLNGSDQRSANLETIYRSLVSQLICQPFRTQYHRSWLDFYLSPAQKREDRLRTLDQTLESMQEEFDHNYIVIDALDECEDSDVLETIVEFMDKLVGRTHCQVHLIVFSRRHERLQIALESLDATEIAIEGENTANDLRTALRAQLSRRKFCRWSAALKKSIETTLLSQANGCFRWLACQLQELEGCATPGAVEETLKQLPKSLHTHYTRVLERIDDRNQVSVRNLLRWVTFAHRPLSIDEVATAITINSDSSDVPLVDGKLELFDVEDFLDSYSSLVSTYRRTVGAYNSENQKTYVQLAHYSVKEFLLSIGIRREIRSSFALDEHLAHASLAASCLAYFLQTVDHGTDEFWDVNPLARYASQFWLRHKQLSSSDWGSTALRALLPNLFDENYPYFRTWLKVADIDRPWARRKIKEEEEAMDKYTPLYCAAWYGLDYITEALLASGSLPDGPCGLYGNALQAAAKNGHLSVIKLLVKEVDVDGLGGRYGSAIAAAAAEGHVEIARELLAAGAKVQPHRGCFDDRRTDALFLAVVNEDLEMVKLLLAHGAQDYYSPKSVIPTTLEAATRTGRSDIVKELLNYKQNMIGYDRVRGAAITISQFSAANRGYIDVLHELSKYAVYLEGTLRSASLAGDLTLVLQCLDEGAKIGAGALHHALVSAAKGGQMTVFLELIVRGATPGTDALAAAIDSKSSSGLEMVRILLDMGIDVNIEDGRPHLPPLLRAIRSEQRDMVVFLVCRGADLHQSLWEAVVRGDYPAFKQLIDLGADLDHQDLKTAPILQAAARGEASIEIAKYLLASGIGPDPPENSPYSKTALMQAIQSNNWEMMHLLLDHGAKVDYTPSSTPLPQTTGRRFGYDCVEVQDEAPLTLAARANNQDACLELIRRGASITADTPITAGTPLLYAVENGLTELMDHLLCGGADPNRQGTVGYNNPTTPLLLAVRKSSMDAVNRLLAAGARVDNQDSEGVSPLHLAAAGKITDVGGIDILCELVHQHKAKINEPRLLNGSRPIHSAAANGTVEHVRVLLDAGADMDARNDAGRTPLHWAAEKGRWDVMELFLDRGADARVRSNDESLQTALELALAARTSPLWRVEVIDGWDDRRIDALLIRLEEAEKIGDYGQATDTQVHH